MCSKNASQLLKCLLDIRLGFPVIALLTQGNGGWIQCEFWKSMSYGIVLNDMQLYFKCIIQSDVIYLQEESSLYLSESALFIMYMLSGGT